MRTRSEVLLCILIVAATTSLLGPTIHDPVDAAVSPSVLITEVNPYDEGVSIQNVCASQVDLMGWCMTDGEGTLTFNRSTVLHPGERLTIVGEVGKNWFCSRSGTIQTDDPCITRTGRFILADSGDEVVLKVGDSVIDQVCWGGSLGADGWSGSPVRISSLTYTMRTSQTDTDTSSDWMVTRAGWTNYVFPGTSAFEASVVPFSFPESGGGPIYKALESASCSVDISIYLISCPNVIALLSSLCDRGVSVRILAEAEPLGVDISTELALLKSIDDGGADVRLINFGDHPQRFVYVHNKYAVIDGDTVIITSENWTSGNMGYGNGNRGWGAVISGKGYAGYMERVFENDFDTVWGDTVCLEDAYPDLKGYRGTLSYVPPDVPEYRSYEASVSPVLSPDNSFSTLRMMMGSAERRIYVEEMDLGDSLSPVNGDTPIAWMASAASRGLDVRFILDSSQSGGGAHVSTVNLINETTGIKAVAVDGGDGFSLIHNKGIVIDGSVWVGSVNWTATSFDRNREVAVLIVSEEVASFFADLFLSDFGVSRTDVEEGGLSFTAEVVRGSGGYAVVLRARGPAGSIFLWAVDGEERCTDVSAAVFRVSSGDHVASVSVEGIDVSEEVSFTVPSEDHGGYVIYLSAAVILLIGTVVAFFRDRPSGGYGDMGWRSGR
ncbi:phospholipase D-like domain-containing protein [Methanomethylophilus alvi]|uniref:phospholipase D-like domain-containing protein n=1 Tax=Methanomethylophilus alvi TaxID=1291540 RepID=UPI0037DD7B7F